MISLRLRAASFAAALALAAPAAAQSDFTTAGKMICVPDRGARCEDGKCEWRNASERDRARPLIVDFAAKEAFVPRDGKNEKIGIVLEDAVKEGVRRVVVSQSEKREANKTMEFAVDKAGKMTGSRSAGRIRFEATCKQS